MVKRCIGKTCRISGRAARHPLVFHVDLDDLINGWVGSQYFELRDALHDLLFVRMATVADLNKGCLGDGDELPYFSLIAAGHLPMRDEG